MRVNACVRADDRGYVLCACAFVHCTRLASLFQAVQGDTCPVRYKNPNVYNVRQCYSFPRHVVSYSCRDSVQSLTDISDATYRLTRAGASESLSILTEKRTQVYGEKIDPTNLMPATAQQVPTPANQP